MDYKNEWLKQLPARVLTWLNYWTGRGKLDSWEVMISRELEKTDGWRATLSHPDAWTLHPVARGKDYIEALPKIISAIEQCEYPTGQEGYYDLNLDLWLNQVGTHHGTPLSDFS